jgi:hypothetical protein
VNSLVLVHTFLRTFRPVISPEFKTLYRFTHGFLFYC